MEADPHKLAGCPVRTVQPRPVPVLHALEGGVVGLGISVEAGEDGGEPRADRAKACVGAFEVVQSRGVPGGAPPAPARRRSTTR